MKRILLIGVAVVALAALMPLPAAASTSAPFLSYRDGKAAAVGGADRWLNSGSVNAPQSYRLERCQRFSRSTVGCLFEWPNIIAGEYGYEEGNATATIDLMEWEIAHRVSAGCVRVTEPDFVTVLNCLPY